MADRGRGETMFFIYDHNMLKKEEDDLKDAILFFTPENFPADDQCALCGQLMGMSEFLLATVGQSQPHMFKFEREKFAVKRSGDYSLVLRGWIFMPDSLLLSQVESLHSTFVFYHGSIDSVRIHFKDNPGGFLPELANIWRLILPSYCMETGNSVTQIFQSLSYTRLYEGGSQLFLQASHLLQSSQRRPYVLAGTIFYKNRVLYTQLPPELTRKLTLLQGQMPHIARKADLELPGGCKVVTVYLSDDDLSYISSLNLQVRKHCKLTDLNTQGKTAENLGITSHRNVKPLEMINTHVDFKRPSKLDGLMSNLSQKALQRVNGKNIKSSLSDVPIVECRIGESLAVSDLEVLNFQENESSVGQRMLVEGSVNESCKEQGPIENEVISHDIVESLTKVSNTENLDHISLEKVDDKVNLLEPLMLLENVELESSNNLKQLEELHFDVAVMEGNTSTGNRNKIVEQPVEPSISDYEDDWAEYHLNKADNICVIEVNNDSKQHTECAEQVNIESDSIDKGEFLRNSKDLHIQTLTNDSSADTITARLYDSLTDDQTETVFKENSHSIHQHKVCVHTNSNGDNNMEYKTVQHIGIDTCICTNNNGDNNMEYKTVQRMGIDASSPSTSNTCEVTCTHSETDSDINIDNLANDTETNILNLPTQYTDTQGCQENCMENVVNLVLNAKKKIISSTELADNDPVSVELDDSPEQDKCAFVTEIDGQTDNTDNKPNMGHLSCGNELSAGNTSRNCTNEIQGLNDVTVYVQCHSDISLVLMMDNVEHYEENLFHALWKGSLAHLADLDYYIKECMESCSEIKDHTNSYSCMRFDSCTADLTGTIENSSSSQVSSNDIHQMIATLHSEFQHDQCHSDVLLRSHFHSCYGYSNQVEEVYFYSESSPKLSGQSQPHEQVLKYGSGLPLARDPFFNLDSLARQPLIKDRFS